MSIGTKISQWWHRPISAEQRRYAGYVGLFGGFWIGILVVAFIGSFADFGVIGKPLGICAVLAGPVIGRWAARRWPKPAMILLLPFAVIGPSN
ncbi:MAG: hypothetical protein ACRCWJ_11990 [Casimicrobium sp.]